MISGVFLVAGVGFEPHGLRVMSPTSYQAALPRDNKLFKVFHALFCCAYVLYHIKHTLSTPFLKKYKFLLFSDTKYTVYDETGLRTDMHAEVYLAPRFWSVHHLGYASGGSETLSGKQKAHGVCDAYTICFLVPETGLEPVRYFHITGF